MTNINQGFMIATSGSANHKAYVFGRDNTKESKCNKPFQWIGMAKISAHMEPG